MSSNPSTFFIPRAETPATKWARRRDIPLAILAWAGVIAIILWGASHIVRTLLLLIVASLLAYAIAPGVKLLQRIMPRWLAIVIIYLVVFSGLSFLIYFIIATALDQYGSLASFVGDSLKSSTNRPTTPLENTLHSFGIAQSQIDSVRTELVKRLEAVAITALPFITGVFDVLLDIVVVAVMSIYFLLDGSRMVNWCRQNMPQVVRANFLLDTLQRIVGGYIRGQILLAILIGLLVGGGLTLFQVPYAILLGVLAFLLEFIPILGTLISGAICTLIALTHGWWIGLGVLVYFVVVHVLEGDIIGPRIVGKAVGLHPIISIAAVIAGAELFGVWGALFASPIAGVVQALLIALWMNWRETRPEQFEQVKEAISEQIDASLSDNPAESQSEKTLLS